MLKLNYVMSECEKHKSLEPQFSLYFDELVGYFKHLRREENNSQSFHILKTNQSSVSKDSLNSKIRYLNSD